MSQMYPAHPISLRPTWLLSTPTPPKSEDTWKGNKVYDTYFQQF
jgi:hypothetical protein